MWPGLEVLPQLSRHAQPEDDRCEHDVGNAVRTASQEGCLGQLLLSFVKQACQLSAVGLCSSSILALSICSRAEGCFI